MVKPTAPFPTHHPLVQNPDGSHSNVRTMTVGVGDRTYVIPSMVGGKQLEEEMAIQLAQRRGLQSYPSFATHDKAEQWIEQHHGSQDPAANAPMRGWYSRQKGGTMPEDEMTPEQRAARMEELLRQADAQEARDEANVAAASSSIREQQQQLMLQQLDRAAQEASTVENRTREILGRTAPPGRTRGGGRARVNRPAREMAAAMENPDLSYDQTGEDANQRRLALMAQNEPEQFAKYEERRRLYFEEQERRRLAQELAEQQAAQTRRNAAALNAESVSRAQEILRRINPRRQY